MLDLLRHPGRVMAATWDLSAGKKDGIHIRLWYHKVCQHQRANFGCEDKLFLLGALTVNLIAVSEMTNLGVFQELSSINNTVKIAVWLLPPNTGLQNDPDGLWTFTCSVPHDVPLGPWHTLCCHAVWTLPLEVIQSCLQTFALNQQPTVGKTSHTVPPLLSNADLPLMVAAAGGLWDLYHSTSSVGSRW